jgi:CheY-like chemotaxis protein
VTRLLLVEDEEILRAATGKGLRRLPGVEVDEAGTVREAVARLEAAPPDLLVSDLDLPDGSGIELLGHLARLGVPARVIFVTAYLKSLGAGIPRRPDVEVREKPVPIDELRRLVEQVLGRDADSPFAPVDYVQLACMGRRSVEIRVGRAGREGRIEIMAGEPWSAEDAQGSGVEAFRRLVTLPGATVEVRTLRGRPRQRTIDQHWEALLLDAARIADERARDGVLPEPPPAEPPSAGRLEQLRNAAVAALLSRDLPRALGLLLEAERLQPGDRMVAANLTRLRQLGVKPPGEPER